MSNKKQTAVKWLVWELNKLGFFPNGVPQEIYNQAKELEKQQKIEMFDKGFDSVEQLNDDYAIEFVEWITNEKSKYAIMYGNQEKRFATFRKDYTTKELLEIFKKEKGL